MSDTRSRDLCYADAVGMPFAFAAAGRKHPCPLYRMEKMSNNISPVMTFLFPDKHYGNSVSAFVLVLRLFFGGLLMWHGIGKIANFDSLSASFYDPLGIGSRMSLLLAIFAEVICTAGIMAGAFYRLALLPVIFSMCIILFVVHRGDGFSTIELPLIFLVMFVMLFIAGAGRFSLDNIIAGQLRKTKA